MRLRQLIVSVASFCVAVANAIYGSDWVALEETRWRSANIKPEKRHYVLAICDEITRSQARYESVAKSTGVPWYAVSVIHNMEGSLNFRTHLHNGDPLSGYTYHVPKGRLPNGHPVFSWEESAVDALILDGLNKDDWFTVADALLNIELFNGSGYLRFHPNVPSPYLYSWTNLYVRGKYVEDGKWSSTAISSQCGVVPLLKNLY